MKGLELARRYYEAYGAPLLAGEFADVAPLIAVGLIGGGSECFGYDDEVSQDHDFEPGFCLFLPDEARVDRRRAFALERAYAKLPKEFEGFRRSALSPVGGNRHGVLRTAEFFAEKVGSPDGALTAAQWLRIPEYALAEATDGEIFADPLGEVTAIRARLAEQPEDVRRKKLAGRLLLMAQSGQYNYRRCLLHGESGAAQLAAVEFVQNAMAAVFLLNRRYMPYYKWSFRALRELKTLSVLAAPFERILTAPNDGAHAENKYDEIEGVASAVIEELRGQELTKAVCGDLEKHAYSVNDGVADAELRNAHILSAV